ncbi:DUF5709 domain-containing protein [Spelaeicoccus albus]|uniref:DUF5709 domain-containing protein n=1 Tax=Spelaeicoccus albus TaxID=1280376 RepID=A0A7Z0D221_9MICO|nr:DUF5709 domain-containing protein [Spelaeicoccus albus]NYI67425.1 hypothetical protein [Spelaeicoccus albus]
MSEAMETHNIPGQAAAGDSDQLQVGDTLDDRGVVDLLDEGYSPPERPSVGWRRGYSTDDDWYGQNLDYRLAQEEPDDYEMSLVEDEGECVGGEVGLRRAGRLQNGSGADGGETIGDVYATDMGIDGGAAGAEEAAVHVIDDDDED